MSTDRDEWIDDLANLIADAEATRPGIKEMREDLHIAHGLLDRLVATRRDLGLTQSQVAELMGVAQPTVSEFEAESTDPRLSTLQRYARALGGRIAIRYVSN